jgi:cytochrome c biogenesis protein CcdA
VFSGYEVRLPDLKCWNQNNELNPQMIGITQPPLWLAAYAAGVLMFFAPCSVGLLPAYLSYFYTNMESSDDGESAIASNIVQTLLLFHGIAIFLIGAIPLFYIAVAGLRILLPGYQMLVPLAKLGTGSTLPPVFAVVIGTTLMILGLNRRAIIEGARVGGFVTSGVLAVYLSIGVIVVVVGQWIEPYLTSLELFAGPLLVALGVMYYFGRSPLEPVDLPERGEATPTAFVGFGLFYGLGSLACNLPVFFGLILSTFTTDSLISGLAMFVAFAAGMGTLMIGVSVAARVTGQSISLGRYGQHLQTGGSVAFMLIGLYVTWFTLRSFQFLSGGAWL